MQNSLYLVYFMDMRLAKDCCNGDYTAARDHWDTAGNIHTSFWNDAEYSEKYRYFRVPCFTLHWIRSMKQKAKGLVNATRSAVSEFDFPDSVVDDIMNFSDGIMLVWSRLESIRELQVQYQGIIEDMRHERGVEMSLHDITNGKNPKIPDLIQ